MTTKEDNAMSQARSGNIAVTVLPQAAGGWVCEVTTSLAGGAGPTKCFHGQSASHALAHALEDLARMFRKEAEAEQNVDWDVVERATSGEVVNRRFHVILHYERVAEEESKFEALTNTLLGNTVVENAEIAIIQVDADLPKPEWTSRDGD
jgi:hypothetical protein